MRLPPTKKKKTTRKTAFVPRSLFLGALTATSVIPLVACGGAVATEAGGDGGSDSKGAFLDGPSFDVALQGFDGQFFGVATTAFDAEPDADGGVFAVAACAFDAGPDGDCFFVADAGFGVAADAFAGDAPFEPDSSFSVGVIAFDASPDSAVGVKHGHK